MKDLETKVDELQKSSDSTSQENGLLRAQVERLQVELREYRKRLSWMTSNGNGLSAMSSGPIAQSRSAQGLKNTDFLFDFPKFGDLPGSHIFNRQNKNDQPKPNNDSHNSSRSTSILSRDNLSGLIGAPAVPSTQSSGSTPILRTFGNTPSSTTSSKTPHKNPKSSSAHDASTSDSPSSSSDSHQSQLLSSNGTSPEPSLNSPPDGKQHDASCGGSINGEESFCARLGMACGNVNNPIPAVQHKATNETNDSQNQHQPQPQPQPQVDDPFGFDWLSQQNGGQFDPVLFGDWREPQDAVLSQDFGSFFNDAFPLPDLGSPSHNLSEVAAPPQQQQPPKKPTQVGSLDHKLFDEEVVPGEDKTQMLSCTKIWYVFLARFARVLCLHLLTICPRDRLQSMEKFRNGEIDVDNLCSELRTKARCSEGGVVVNQNDVDDIMGRAK